MTTFEYLSVLFSVVVGLAITQALAGLLRAVRHRRTAKVYWPTIIWTGAILLWTIGFWWFTGFGLSGLDEWHFRTLLFVFSYASALFFLLGLLHPRDIGPDFDMQGDFEANRTWFFGVFLVLGILDVVDTWSKQLAEGASSPLQGRSLGEYSIFLALWILGSVVSLRTRNGRILGGFGLLYLLAVLYISNRYGAVLGPLLDLR